MSHGINIFWIGHHCRDFARNEAKCIYFIPPLALGSIPAIVLACRLI